MKRSAIVALAVVVAWLPWSLGASQQKPVRTTPVHTDGGLEAPLALAELVAKSELVVLGRVTALSAADRKSHTDPADGLVLTVYTVRLATVFKTDTRLSPTKLTIPVQRLGGVRERQDHIEQVVPEGFDNFDEQGRYVLFLRHLVDDKYTPIPIKGNAAFRVTAGNTIVPLGDGPLSRSFAGTPLSALAAELLRLGGGR